MKQEIKKIIKKVLRHGSGQAVEGEIPEFSVEVSDDQTHGDYSSNVALVLSKKLGKNPREVAEEIKNKIEKSFGVAQDANSLFAKIEIAGPGFINFFVSDDFFIEKLESVDKNYGKGSGLKGKKVIVDYTDPNILKDFHIGHLMSNSVGESLSRIFEFQGAKVKRVCYQSDVGVSVAKAVWGKINNKDLAWPQAYVVGSEKYESDEIARKEIVALNKKIFERSDKEVNKLYDAGKKWSLLQFDKIYKKLGTKFDCFIFESQVADLGKEIVGKGLEKGIFEKGDNGAIIFKGEKYGFHTRVFINSEGLPTYEGKDLGLAEIKYKKYAYDQSVIVTGNEVNDYFKVMLCAMDKINPSLAAKTKHIGHGMLRLPEGKMSSRTGKVITGESLIEKVEELVKEKIKERELSEKEKKEITESVAVGAIRYSILKQSIGSDIIYDFDKSISFEGDSGPYLQYSYTRAESVLNKAKREGIKPSFSRHSGIPPEAGKKVMPEISELEKKLCYFPEVVSQAGEAYQPHVLVLYLTELAGLFNGYYAKNKIVDKSDEFSPYKVALTKAFTIVMENGLWMLGIKTLNKM